MITTIGKPKEFDEKLTKIFTKDLQYTFMSKDPYIMFIRRIQDIDEYITVTYWFDWNHIIVRYLTIFNINYHVINFKLRYRYKESKYGEMFICNIIAAIMYILYGLNLDELINKLSTASSHYMETEEYRVSINKNIEYNDKECIVNKTIQFLILPTSSNKENYYEPILHSYW